MPLIRLIVIVPGVVLIYIHVDGIPDILWTTRGLLTASTQIVILLWRRCTEEACWSSRSPRTTRRCLEG